MSENLELLILRGLINTEEFTRKVVPFLEQEYFEGTPRKIFKLIVEFVNKYNTLPTKDVFKIELESQPNINENDMLEIASHFGELFSSPEVDVSWLIDRTEKWCQERAIQIALFKSIDILEGNDKHLTKNAIPELLTDALSVGFNIDIGHDYFDDAEERFESYHRVDDRLPTGIEIMDKVLRGGFAKKSLNVALAGTGVGKSLMMCFVAANAMMLGKNVMYITMEMSEEMISERIDANLMDLAIQDVESLRKSDYLQRIDKLKSKTIGKLLVKEFPTASANSSHFRALLREARIKKKFEPDLLVVDYLNICASSRMKMANNSYNYVKAIAEELRGLAMEFNVPLLSATQATRDANGNSDMNLKDTSESFGLPATADFMFAMISNEDYEERKQIQFKQLKNRFNDTNYYKRFLVGVDRSKMQLFDLDNETVQVKELTEFDKPATQDKSFNASKYKDLLT